MERDKHVLMRMWAGRTVGWQRHMRETRATALVMRNIRPRFRSANEHTLVSFHHVIEVMKGKKREKNTVLKKESRFILKAKNITL